MINKIKKHLHENKNRLFHLAAIEISNYFLSKIGIYE